MTRIFSWALALLIASGLLFNALAGSWTDIFRSVPEQAEREYKAEKYDKALELYQEAQTRNPDSDTLAYNLGNTLFQLGRYEEAAGQYGRILEKEKPALSPRSVYNMGNTLFRMGRQTENQQLLSQALEAYKKSIVLNPEDEDPKYNYELTRRLIREQEQKQQQQQQQQKEKNQDKQQRQQNQQQNEQKKKEEPERQEKMDQQQQQQAQQQEQKEQQPQPVQPGQMSKEEAERILNALLQMEKDMQEKEKEKKAAAQRGRGPDW